MGAAYHSREPLLEGNCIWELDLTLTKQRYIVGLLMIMAFIKEADQHIPKSMATLSGKSNQLCGNLQFVRCRFLNFSEGV